MEKFLAIVAFGIAWLSLGLFMSLYYKGFMCAEWRQCSTCKHIERRWHAWAWIMDGVIAVIALFFLFWLFK
jgi:hypothetical protein